jgi:hypothetical protein
MRMASCVPGELIPCASVWHDPGITPCCRNRLIAAARNDSFVLTRFVVEAGDDGAAQPRSGAVFLFILPG